MHAKPTPLFSLLLLQLSLTFSFLAKTSNCGSDSLIYTRCSPSKFHPGTPYESNMNSVLTSIVNSSASTNYNNFKSSLPGSKQNDVVYGLFQCRGDLRHSDCRSCIATAVNQLGNTCGDETGGAVQLDGCFVRYDNISFVGVEDKTVVVIECGPSIGVDSDTLTRRDAVLDYLTNQGEYFRVAGSGNFQGVAQCTKDLSVGECQDCLVNAIGRLRKECGTSTRGDMFLAKCYARYSESGFPTKSGKKDNKHGGNDNLQKTLAIIIGVVAGVALLILFLSAWSRRLHKRFKMLPGPIRSI